MAVTPNSVVSPQTPYMVVGSLAAVTACTTRAPTATASLAAANIVVLVPASDNVNGLAISKVGIKACSSSFTAPSAAQTITLWVWDVTTAWPRYELLTPAAVTPSTTAISLEQDRTFDDFILKAGHALYMSTSITTTAATTAMCVTVHGASL